MLCPCERSVEMSLDATERSVCATVLGYAGVLIFAVNFAFGQRTLEYDRSVVSQVRIDARDLGYPPDDVIPSGESAVTALSVAPNGTIYGATSGTRSHLFVLDPLHGYVQPLGFLKDVTTVHGLVIASDGDVFIGGTGNDASPGGHLLRYHPTADQGAHPIQINAACGTEDLGAPAEHEGIYALAADRGRSLIYGLTYPSGNFFVYDIASRKFMLRGKVAEHKIHGEKFERDRLIGSAIVVNKDFAYTSGEDGALYRYIPDSPSIERLNLTVPAEPGREGYNRVEAWMSDGADVLYGGTTDGYLFRFHTDSLTLENLGKPLNQYRINGLVMAHNGKLYGTGGDDDDMARLFSYDPATGAYQILGFVDVNRRPYYTWQAYRIGAICIGVDGTVYLGESERKSRLYLYYPQ
jgi:hypothetical protein